LASRDAIIAADCRRRGARRAGRPVAVHPRRRPLMAEHPPALSYAHGTSDVALLGQTIGDNLRATAERYPDRQALVLCPQTSRATYAQLWEATTACARGLLALGVKPGDRVGVWSANTYEWVVVQYASARVGAILVNVNPAYLAPELGYVLRQSGVSVLLYARGFRQVAYGPMLESVRPDCPDLRHAL